MSSVLTRDVVFCEILKRLFEKTESFCLRAVRRAGDNGITADLLEEGGDVALEKLAALFSECLWAQKVPIAWKKRQHYSDS